MRTWLNVDSKRPHLAVRLALLIWGFIMTSPVSQADQPAPLAVDAWKSGSLPFSFKYGGKDSSQILSTWRQIQETIPSEGGEIHRTTFFDPVSALQVTAEVRTFKDYPAVDWVLKFTNASTTDSAIIEDVQPLHWTMPIQAQPVLHWAMGSNAGGDDFQPRDTPLAAGKNAQLNSTGGRSSNNNLPFFNLQDGDHGLIGAIGWTGNWVAHFNPSADGKMLAFDAGMQKTHFLLHDGESVRTLRIVLLDWKGDRGDAQNVWRQLVLNFYSPRDAKGDVVTVPLAFGEGNDGSLEAKLKTIQALHDRKVPLDDYWVDASWYGNGGDWGGQRGNWSVNTKLYPDGSLKPLGDALAADGYGFILWLEAEAAMPGSAFLTEHPGWYMRRSDPNAQALLDLGNPIARQRMTDFLIKLFKDSGVTWYRQDFNVEPDSYWAAKDTPDRVGVAEMEDIAGLYTFWDDMHKAGFQVDNCASGGRRLDIETISRSVSLFRTDHSCNFFDPLDNQMLTQALNVWLPLNSGVYAGVAPGTPNSGASLVYAMRSSYSAGWVFGTDRLSIDMMKPGGDEFKEVRPFFTGNFHPLTPYTNDKGAWTIWQLHRPDWKSGAILAFRRQDSAAVAMKAALHEIDPNAQYEVEMRPGFEKGEAKTMSGQELANLEIAIPGQPGSMLIFYRQK